MICDSTIIVAIIAGLSASFLKPLVDGLVCMIRRHNERKEADEDITESLEERVAELETLKKVFTEDIAFNKQAIHLLLKDKVIYLTEEAVRNNRITISVKAFINQSVDLLHTDGENGEMTACIEAIKDLPVVS